jgi:hypothetical protein
MVYFRNNYVAHKSLKYDKPVPFFDIAYKAAIFLDLWLRDQIKPDIIENKPFEKLEVDYIDRISKTLNIIVKREK